MRHPMVRLVLKATGVALFVGGLIGEVMNLECQTNRPTRRSWAAASFAVAGAALAVKG